MSSTTYTDEHVESMVRGLGASDKYKSPLSNKQIKEKINPDLIYTKEWRQAELQSRKSIRRWSTFAAALPLLLLFFTNALFIPFALMLAVISYIWCDNSLRKKDNDDSSNLTGAYSSLAITNSEIKEIMRNDEKK